MASFSVLVMATTFPTFRPPTPDSPAFEYPTQDKNNPYRRTGSGES
jgi:hypothetical protein